MTEVRIERPQSVARLVEQHEGIATALNEASEVLGVNLFAYLDKLAGGEWVTIDHVHDLVDELRREPLRRRFHLEAVPDSSKAMFSAADLVEVAVEAEGFSRLPAPFVPKVKLASSTLEREYAKRCADIVARMASSAIDRERRHRVVSEMSRFATGVDRAAKVYGRPWPASVWIGVLFELASEGLEDGFTVLARHLSGLSTPADATEEDEKQVAQTLEALARHGVMRIPSPTWTPKAVITQTSREFLAIAGNIVDAHFVEDPSVSRRTFRLAIVPNEVVQMELLVWGLIENPFVTRAKGTVLSASGIDAALHHVIRMRAGN